MKRKWIVCLVLAVLAACMLWFAACTKGDDPGGETPGSGLNVEISGRVVDGDAAVSGAEVSLKDAAAAVDESVVTKEDGKFVFSDIPKTKTYTVTISKEGYYDKSITLTPLQISEGKNAMGDISFTKPEAMLDLTGTTVALDGVTPVGGVTVRVEEFGLQAVSGADGTFTLNDLPKPPEGVSLTLTCGKEYYEDAEYTFGADELADGNVGNLAVSMGFGSAEGSLSSKYAFIREENGLRLIAEYSSGLSGGQHAQFHIHVGDNVNGTVYMILLAESRETINRFWQIDADYALWVRPVSSFENAQISSFANAQLKVTDNKRLDFFIPYEDLGMTGDETVGVIAYSQVLSADGSKWLWQVFGQNAPVTGANYFEYPMFYELDASGNIAPREYTAQTVSGKVTDESGAPVADAEVVLTGKGGSYTAVTAADGTYSVENVSRVYALQMQVFKDGFNAHEEEISLETLQETTVRKDVQLSAVKETMEVTGNVQTILKKALGGVTVRVAGSTEGVQTDANGNFTLTGVPADGETINLEFSKDNYALRNVQANVAQLKESGGVLQTVEMYSEISPDGQKIRFASAITDNELLFKVTTGGGFIVPELIWFEFQIGDYETGTSYILILGPDGSAVALEAPTKSILETGWLPTTLNFECVPQVNAADGSATFDISVGLAQFAGFDAEDGIGVGISTALTDGNVCFTGTGNISFTADVTRIQYHEFFTFTKDGAYTVRA